MVLGFFKTLFDAEARRAAQEREAAVAAAVETVIGGTDPRLRMVNGYRKKLAPSVARALAHAEAAANQIPGPIDVTKKTFGSAPQVRALFVSIDHLCDTFGQSHSLREFLARPENRNVSTCYALIAMEKSEKQVFGPALDGEVVRQDVSQTVINFKSQHFATPAPDIQTLRRELAEEAFEHLVGCALRRIVSLKVKSEELKERRLLLQRKLEERQAKKRGLGGTLFGAPTLDGTMTMDIRRQLTDTDEELQAASVSLRTLNDYISQIRDVLAHPENHLRLDTLTVRLDRSGVKRTADDRRPGENVEFAEIDLGEGQRAVGIIVAYSPKELPPSGVPKVVFGI